MHKSPSLLQRLVPALQSALVTWAGSTGLTWLYVFKVLLVATATLWLAMRLELPQPSTAVITVFIVMQPQSGQVLAKSFYRIIGSLVGLTVMVAITAAVAQQPVLYVLCMAIWIGFCTAGAARYRDFRAYAFVLAGYTATLVGIPATAHPENAFILAVWRLLEVSLGILCSTAVSALIAPRSSAKAMRLALYARFGTFAGFVLNTLPGGNQQAFDAGNIRFTAEVVGLEALRSASTFEDPHMRLRNGRLLRLNSEFMQLATRYHALHQLLERLRAAGSLPVLAALAAPLTALTALLQPWNGRSLSDRDAADLVVQLPGHAQQLNAALQRARPALADRPLRVDFDTAAQLLEQFVLALNDYVLTHESLASHRHERENWHGSFAAKANGLGAAVAGLRTALIVLSFSTLWIVTAWPSGSTFTLTAVAVAALASASPNPARVVRQMAGGTALAALLGITETFLIYPHLDGFALLALALAPVFALGAWLTTRPQWGGYGLGLLIFFSFAGVPGNLTLYDPTKMFNDYLALVLSMALAAVVSAVVLPPAGAWLWRRLERDLRRQIVRLCAPRGAVTVATFNSSTRDLLNQAYGLGANAPQAQARLLRWTFVVLEVGHAVIELPARQDRSRSRSDKSRAIEQLKVSLTQAFEHPGNDTWHQALVAVDQAIAGLGGTSAAATLVDQRTLNYLHFIRSSLLDPQSPFLALEVVHAAA